MDAATDKWSRIKLLFDGALKHKQEARAEYLARNCSDEDLRDLVEKLLVCHEQASGFIASSFPARVAASILNQHFTFSPGDVLAGRFRIACMIARGGMGEVYKAQDEVLQALVAVKTIRPDILQLRGSLERFMHEVQVSKQVTHPNVCRVFDLSVHHTLDRPEIRGQDIYFVSMELLEGETLAERLRRTGRMTTQDALPLITQMCSALGAAHDVRIVHRDFKPGNVVLVPSKTKNGERLVVTDFGLATHSAGDLGASLTLAAQNEIVGTPAYMSPEQLQDCELTTASDIYSLGLVMYEMVTGAHPFEAETPVSILFKRLTETLPSPRTIVPDLDHGWEDVILKCLENKPEKRFAEAREVVEALTTSRRANRQGRTLLAGSLFRVPRPHRHAHVPVRGTVDKNSHGEGRTPHSVGQSLSKQIAISKAPLLLTTLLVIIFGFQYRVTAANIISSASEYLQAVRSDRIDLPSSRQGRLDKFIQDLTSFLEAELSKKGTSPYYRAWTIAQIVDSLAGLTALDEASLGEFFDHQKEACDCWRQQPGQPEHIAATAWVLTAFSRIKRPATHEELNFLIRNQNIEGWWPIFPTNGDRINASTYATTWALLALGEQLRNHSVPSGDQENVKAAIQAGRAWLRKTEIERKARWYDYPFAVERVESVSLAGLVLHTLHATGEASSIEIDRLWLDEIPDPDSFSLLADERSSRAVDLLKGGFERDATRNYIFPWTLIATADAYPNGRWSERAKGLRFVKRSIERLGELRGRLRELPWTAAEFEIALRYLKDREAAVSVLDAALRDR